MEHKPLSSRKEAELLRIEILRKSLCNRTGEEVYLVATPDEYESSQQQRPCDAILEGRKVRFAVELTTIDSYMGQRSDDDRFRTVMGDLERRVGNIPDWVEVTIDVAAIPTGYDWRQLSVSLEAWLIGHLQEFPYDRRVPVQIPDVPFTFWVRREHGWGKGQIVVMRHIPVDIEERRCAVIKRALETKRGVLDHYKRQGYVTILLMEDYDFVLTNRHIILESFRKVFPLELCADTIDDVYLIETATSPWTISPLKIGSQIPEEPLPEWPDAPGYP